MTGAVLQFPPLLVRTRDRDRVCSSTCVGEWSGPWAGSPSSVIIRWTMDPGLRFMRIGAA